ncbi:MAG TPA: S24/S26 family peptidase [Candidatus Binataceae bacterium]|nr:S24/S26 family peptidase [Candidatus Binataceae bacterium]
MSGEFSAKVNPELRDRIGCELVAEALRLSGEIRLQVTGTSMLPSVWPGDVLLVRGGGDSVPSIGQIVLFLRDGRLFAHRVVARSDAGGRASVVTRGDAVPQCDAPIPGSEVLGSVAGILRDGSPRVPPSELSRGTRLLAFGLRHSAVIRRLTMLVAGASPRGEPQAETMRPV